MRWGLANFVSISRLGLLGLWIYCYASGSAWTLPVMVIIVLTDLADGAIARRLKTAGPLGAKLDVACDVAVCFVGALIAGLSEPLFLAVAGMMAINLLSWLMLCSTAGRRGYTRFGRYNGSACYSLLIVVSAAPWTTLLGTTGQSMIKLVALCTVAAVLGLSTVENGTTVYTTKRITPKSARSDTISSRP